MARHLCRASNINNKALLVSIIMGVCLSSSIATTTIARSIDAMAYRVTVDDDRLSSLLYPSSVGTFDDRVKFRQSMQATPTQDHSMENYNYVNDMNIYDRYIVVLREGSSTEDRSTLIEEIKKDSSLDQIRIPQFIDEYNNVFVGFSISIPRGDTNILKVIQNNPRVEIVEKDQQVHMFAQTLPTGVNRVDGDLSSTESGNGQGSVDVDIAILDTGVDLDHPDLNVYRERTFVSGTSSADDDEGHGTHVAGIAAAKDNNMGVVGIAPGARIWAVKVLDSTGSGFISDIIAAIDYLTQNADQVDVGNMSFGCECSSSALDTALNNSVEKGIVYTAAAGNDGSDASSFSPANNPNVIAVSAIVDTDGKCGGQGHSTTAGGDDAFASFSNFGSTVDIAAPGVLIYSTFPDDSYATMSGTSMASPHVAGAAALLKSIQPTATPSQIKESLFSTGSKPSTICDGNGHGYFTGDPDQFHEPLLYLKHQPGSLLYVFATQTNNIGTIKSYYDIVFRTSTSGPIKQIDVDFPPGTYVGVSLLVETVGIGPGKISASGTTATGQTITYTVNNADTIPAGTNIRLQFSNIANPQEPSRSYSVTVTTIDSNNLVLDGPTQSRSYIIK
ncbi:MAG: S8 family serine peptidase [Nitrososphaeraceae archaeon]|nr:S8 family serine peptidase [Nitrososphaeraceae archaeon]